MRGYVRPGRNGASLTVYYDRGATGWSLLLNVCHESVLAFAVEAATEIIARVVRDHERMKAEALSGGGGGRGPLPGNVVLI